MINILLGILLISTLSILILVLLIKFGGTIISWILDGITGFFTNPLQSLLKLLITIIVIITLVAIFVLLVISCF